MVAARSDRPRALPEGREVAAACDAPGLAERETVDGINIDAKTAEFETGLAAAEQECLSLCNEPSGLRPAQVVRRAPKDAWGCAAARKST